ncbi:TadE/TadG family type IV pilus assembly protein [Rhizobium lusitanum]|uniref:TadE-like domain-containing protein n=1 Tax=Rhizobium lusitanum TaxID=293958 RepID=A0A7X0IUM7_9HYPH|nr:TadE/TadG family type IV pilus assembly protein [Rhizobium lusitanum]MBB6487048.1 hypothetical protein [Rhizobium lusitanum]
MDSQPEASLADLGFWNSMLHSRTFWVPRDHGLLFFTFALALAAFASMLILPRLSARRRHIASVHADTSGSTTMMDFVLVTPLFVFFMFLVFQFAILAKNHIFTHYAAYMAARSARVYLCPTIPISVGSFVDATMFNIKVCDNSIANQKAETAARIALIPAAPYKELHCRSGCQPPQSLLKNVTEATRVSSRWGAIQRQAIYMFDTDNVKVKIALAPIATYSTLKRTPALPVVALVQVRFLLLDYAGWIFATGQRKDGNYYTLSTAEVTLL